MTSDWKHYSPADPESGSFGPSEADDVTTAQWNDFQIQTALGKADALADELNWNLNDDGALQDLLNVHASAFLCLLREPDREWSLDDVLNAGWTDAAPVDPDYLTGAEWVRGWH